MRPVSANVFSKKIANSLKHFPSALILILILAGCASRDTIHSVVISIPQQEMFVFEKKSLIAIYPVSTSRFGLSDRQGSYGTPLGNLKVAEKIGGGVRSGMVFKSRRPTGEIVPPNAPGRDPIVTRILWLSGLDAQNRNAHRRCIYIHGTPDERDLGRTASFGCIRMRSADIVQLYQKIGVGTRVDIRNSAFAPVPLPVAALAPVVATRVAPTSLTVRRE